MHPRASSRSCLSVSPRRCPPGTLIVRCSKHISLGPVGASPPGRRRGSAGGPQWVIAAKALSVRGESGPVGPGPVCTDDRCQPEPRSCSRTALTSPAWSSLMTRRTPWRPRSTSERMKAGQARALVVARRRARGPGPAARPIMATPVATRAAMDTTRPCLADLEVRRVEPDIRDTPRRERAAPEGRDLGVERGADPAHLAAADPGDARGPRRDRRPGGSRHPGRRPPGRPRAGPARPAAAARAGDGKYDAVADPRDREIDRAHAGVPARSR